MTRNHFHNILRSKGFEVLVDPGSTQKIFDEKSSHMISTLRERGHIVSNKTLSNGENLIVVNGLNHGDKDGAYILRIVDLVTYEWQKVQ